MGILDEVAQRDGDDHVVGHLDADAVLAGDRGDDTHLAGEGEGDVVGQPGHLRDLRAGGRRDLVGRDRRPRKDILDGAHYAVVGEGFDDLGALLRELLLVDRLARLDAAPAARQVIGCRQVEGGARRRDGQRERDASDHLAMDHLDGRRNVEPVGRRPPDRRHRRGRDSRYGCDRDGRESGTEGRSERTALGHPGGRPSDRDRPGGARLRRLRRRCCEPLDEARQGSHGHEEQPYEGPEEIHDAGEQAREGDEEADGRGLGGGGHGL